MDFDQLETFLEVARHASFSRAAEKRFRTQPAISSQIRGIEEEVGAKLFDRSGGKVSLTAAGKAFLKYVEETLDARKAMMVAIAEMERVPRGEIIVGANEGTCLHILPYVFAEFKKQYPDVSVNIKRADYAKVLESIIDNSVDFGVVSLPVNDNPGLPIKESQTGIKFYAEMRILNERGRHETAIAGLPPARRR